jgi:hypothetical protein
MKKLLILAVVFIFGIYRAYGQGDLNEQGKIFFRNERSVGILLNTDGFGLSYREGKRLDFLNKRILDVDLGTLKNPKEIKLSNPYYQTPGTFVYGKINSVIFIRGGFGHQHEVFKKADLGGIAIRYFYSGGPIFAIYKPIYYKILNATSISGEFNITEEKLDVTKFDPSMIYSKSSFFKGLNETKMLPGLFVKGGFNFEYSKQDKVIHAIELGAQLNFFPKKIPIMAENSNKAIFFSLFASYRFGVVIDPLDPESNKFSNIFSRKRQ